MHPLDRIITRKELPKTQKSVCYVCMKVFITYQGAKTVPPQPDHVVRRDQIKPIAVCEDEYCKAMEIKRQEALFQMVIAPDRERYFAVRDERYS